MHARLRGACNARLSGSGPHSHNECESVNEGRESSIESTGGRRRRKEEVEWRKGGEDQLRLKWRPPPPPPPQHEGEGTGIEAYLSSFPGIAHEGGNKGKVSKSGGKEGGGFSKAP